MKIIVLGIRGFPNVQGGVETHCEELFPRLVKLGCDVTVITRTPYIPKDKRIKEYNGVKFKKLWAPRIKSLEAIIHSILGVFYARLNNPDILHIQAIGPSLVAPLAKVLGMKVVVTNHGPDYNRAKWGRFAKIFLKLGERLGTKYADAVIAISGVIKETLKKKYNRPDVFLIHNGVKIPQPSQHTDFLEVLGVEKEHYVFSVGRFVEEKAFHDLINAFNLVKGDGYKLVIAGDSDHPTEYSRRLKKMSKDNGVILTGFIKGEKLNQLFSYSKLFVLPSYHEGLPIALLEAMSYNLDVLVSDIPANLEVGLEKDCYFKVGDINDLSVKIFKKLRKSRSGNYRNIIKEKYNWDKIALQTYKVYKSILN
jgi:glycosyltransferase involved in cell wall biosynthesis